MGDSTSLPERQYFNKFHASDNKNNGGSNSGSGNSSGGGGMFDGAVNEAKVMMEEASKAAVELAIEQSEHQLVDKGGQNIQSLTR